MPCRTLVGRIDSGGRVLAGAISSEEKTLAGVVPGTLELQYVIDAPEYDGTYDVTPTVDGETLETAGKFMRDDVTVNAIPIFSVGNAAGGSTVYIANEV